MTKNALVTRGIDEVAHGALVRNLQARVEMCSADEVRVVDRFLMRLEKGRIDYGPLNLANDSRDWHSELREEREDCLVYQTIIDVAAERRRVDAIAALEADEVCIEVG